MKLILVLIFFIPQISCANYQYYRFDAKKIKINDATYRRYVIPQLKSLVKEYYHILEKIDPLQKEVIKIKSKTADIRGVWDEIKSDCVVISPVCSSGLRKIYHLSQYLVEKMSFSKERKNVDSTLKLHGSLDKLFNLNYKNLHALEEHLITFDTPLFPHNKIHRHLGENLHLMTLTCELAMTGKLIPEIQEEFDFIWNHFFKRLEGHLLKEQGQKYLLSRLGELNISWNAFSMKMTKGNLKVPREISKIVKIMHNRWNSVLKVILRQK